MSMIFRPLVGTFVREPQLATLDAALSDTFRLSNATSWMHLHTLTRRRPVRLLIVDPFVHESGGADKLSRLFKAYPELPVILYFPPKPSCFQEVLRLPRTGRIDYLLQTIEDSHERILRIVRKMFHSEVKFSLKRSLRRRLRELTPSLQETLNSLIDSPEGFARSSEIAAHSGVGTACLYRELRNSRLRSPKHFIIASRAMAAFLSLKNPGILVGDVSEQLGYVHPRILSKHFHLVFGVSPSESRRKVQPETAVKRVVDFIRV